jgi:signal transduction histidine kinase/ActR/RegA family two-component response regulator
MASLEPFTDASGRLVEGRCILVNTTEQRHLEEQLRKAQRMEAIGTLAGGVAHDLSNTLAAIVGYPDLLLMDVAPDDPMHEPLIKLRSAGGRAAAIVQDLLTLSRRGVAITDIVDLNDAFNEYLASPEYDDLLKHHPNFEMVVDLAAGLAPIKGSPIHLIKTIMNVVHNAAEALADNGVIRVSTRNAYVGPEDFPEKYVPGEYVVFSVEDNGHGISPEDLKRVFEPFFTKKVMGRSGTGLGMAIVWGAVQDHNGFIDIHSAIGKGTTVDLYFPVTTDSAVYQPSEKKVAGLMGNGEKILVADDTSEHRDIALHMLNRLGYDVTVVGSGMALVGRLREGYRPDVIILDATLELDRSGLSICEQIKHICPEQKAIIITGLSKPAHMKQVLALGIGNYVKKPYNLKDIGAAVRYEIDRRCSPEPRRCKTSR